MKIFKISKFNLIFERKPNMKNVTIKVNNNLTFTAPANSEIVKDYEEFITQDLVKRMKATTVFPPFLHPNLVKGAELQYAFDTTNEMNETYFQNLRMALYTFFSHYLNNFELIYQDRLYNDEVALNTLRDVVQNENVNAVHVIKLNFKWN